MCVMKLVSHRGMAFILIGWSAIQLVCFFDVILCVPVHAMPKKLRYFSNVSLTKTLRSNDVVEFSCTLKSFLLTEEATS